MRTERFKGALLSTLLIASLLSPILLISPTAAWGQEIGWTRQFGTSDNDYAPGLAVDASGNVYIAGWTEGALPGKSSSGGTDAFIRKYDGSGNEIWTRQFGTSDNDIARGVVVDTSGNVYVAGETRGALPGQTSSGGRDAFVRKYDGSGNEIWTKQFGTPSTDFAKSIAVDASGNVYVAGETWNALPGQSYAGGGDTFVRKYDGSGNEFWTRQFGTFTTDSAYGVTVDTSGNVYVAGTTGGALPEQSSSGGWDAFVRKYDGSGNEIWTRQFGSSATDFAESVAVDASDNVYVAGETWGALPGQTSSGYEDAFVRKYDGSGNELWTRQFGTSTSDVARGVVVDTSDNVYVAGYTFGALPGQSYAGEGDVLLVKFVQITAPPTDFSIELAIAIAIGCAVTVAALYMRRRNPRK